MRLAWTVGCLLALNVAPAEAQTPLGETKVVVEVKGDAATHADAFSRALRRELVDALGRLASSREFQQEQRRLGVSKKKLTQPSNLAKAARGVGAGYLVFARLTKDKGAFSARAYLLDAQSSKILLEHVERYQKGEAEAAGRNAAARVLTRLRSLVEAPVAIAPPPPTTLTEPQSLLTTKEPPLTKEPPKTVAAVEPPKTVAPSPKTVAPEPKTVAPMETVEAVEPEPPMARPSVAEVTLTLAGGLGLVRNYALSAPDLGPSRLSHSLDPLSLVAGEVDFHSPRYGFGIAVRGAYRYVRYTLSTDGAQEQPTGALVDLAFLAKYQWVLGNKISLVPLGGLRVAMQSVREHDGNVVPSARSTALVVGLGALLELRPQLHVLASLDGGAVLGYSESPTTTGEDGGGFTIGADLSLKAWLTSRVALAIDNRFSYDRIGFTDAPTRPVANGERASLTNARLGLTDLRSAIGLALRF